MKEPPERTENNDDTTASKKKQPEAKPWVHQEADTYRKTAEKLVHFNTKTVNSNAAAVGIRLASGDELDLPYVSARTLMNSGVELELDYAEGGAAQAGIIKQMMACRKNDPFAEAATSEEKQIIEEVVKKTSSQPVELGTNSVDLRLRQILIPLETEERGYVAVTPVTSGSVCHYLFDREEGLVTRHNQNVRDLSQNKDNTPLPVWYIRQARMGIGGANPQNIGRLTRDMQQPILTVAPEQNWSLRHAFSVYHKGITLDFNQPGPLNDALKAYCNAFLDTLKDRENDRLETSMILRVVETAILRELGDLVVAEGQRAFRQLRLHQNDLPRRHRLEGAVEPEEYELVSRDVHGAIRGLIDFRLREKDYRKNDDGEPIDWPHEIAVYITDAMMKATYRKNGQTFHFLALDHQGRQNLETQLEGYFR